MSALKYLQNAELIFDIPAGNITRDSAGNEVQNTTTQTVKASLVQPERYSSAEIVGTDTAQVYLRGVVLGQLPANAQLQTTCNLRLFNSRKQVYQSGKFLITGLFNSRSKLTSKYLGLQIEGFLVELFAEKTVASLDLSKSVNSMFIPLV